MHSTRKIINNRCMQEFVKDKEYMRVLPSPYNKKSQDAMICVGTPIISTVNDTTLNIVSSDIFTVTKINKDTETFSFTNASIR